MLEKIDLQTLEKQALNVREHIIRLSTDGGCFIGASLSCADLIVYLYEKFLNVDPQRWDDPDRDYFLLSKGHDVPALYGTFVEQGWMKEEKLRQHLHPGQNVYWHPNRSIPGVEFHSGSLGHLLSVAVGLAMDIKMRGGKNRVIVMTGDGELNEGSNWEALLVAQAYQLDQLTILVDRNQFQANMATEELIPLEPLADKFEAFGARVHRFDGHDFEQIDTAFSKIPLQSNGPSCLIADTIRGKGLPSISERADRWFCNFSHDEVEQLLEELHGITSAKITSEKLIVR